MTTIEHKNSVYAYYFYRLIQRAENITLLYNTASDGLNRGGCRASCSSFSSSLPTTSHANIWKPDNLPNKASRLKYARRKRYYNGCTTHTTSAGIPTHSFRLRHLTPTSLPPQILLPLRCRTESSRRGKRRDRLRPVRNHLPPFRRAGIPGPHGQRKGDTPGRPGAVAPQRRKVAVIRRHRFQGGVFPCACR